MVRDRHSIDRDPMRLVLAFLLIAATVGFASAQGTFQGTPQGTSKRTPQATPQAAPQATRKETPNEKDELLRQRLLLKERFNKGWDVQIENAQDPVRARARCKAEARRHYSALHPIKRRKFVQECIARSRR
jgi:hypothetical protein